ncbi:MAG TPA: glycoside hydrolase family 3 N-terminal domain-containing protein [Rariglobus sp.]|nr:glycoside hydrolase family 3 N-terminal domain-containing protein [Rariglobus sp.]
MAVAAGLFSSQAAAESAKMPFQDASLPIEQRIADLIARMTPEEKARQLDMYAGNGYVIEVARQRGIEKDATDHGDAKLKEGLFSKFDNATHASTDATLVPENVKQILGDKGVGSFHDIYPTPEQYNVLQKWVLENSRLPIPALFLEEGLHGSLHFDRTNFPTPLNLASTWDTAIARQTGAAIASEMRATGVAVCLGPVLDLAREPRWGRVEETMGEDPWLVGRMGTAFIQGMQGDSLAANNTMCAMPKHFAGHGSPEAGLNTSVLHAGEREMRMTMLKPFETAFTEGGALTTMAAYHEIDGIPCAANPWLLRTILRKEWGFRGLVLSDLGAIRHIYHRYHLADSVEDAVCIAINAGMNMQFFDFSHEEFQAGVVNGLKAGKLTPEVLDAAVADVLRVKFILGLFDNPYVDPALDAKVRRCAEHNALSLQSARESMTLLRNENHLLPLSKSLTRIALLGRNGDEAQLGDYADGAILRAHESMLGALKKALPAAQIVFDKGEDVKAAISKTADASVIILALGEWQGVSGEGHDRQSLDLPGNQQQLLEAAKATGKPVVLVLQNGRPLTIPWAAENIPAILEAWYPGEFGARAIVETLFGDNNPAGRLPVTFPRTLGQIPVYYGFDEGGRGGNYSDGSKVPLYSFGFGLSYTTFKYANVKAVATDIASDIIVTADVTNTGKLDGDEVAQLYIHQKVNSVVTPNKALHGFERIHLKAGETRTVTFRVKPKSLELWNTNHEWVVEPGAFTAAVGGSSTDTLVTEFTLAAK